MDLRNRLAGTAVVLLVLAVAAGASAGGKPLIVYVSPNPIGVNDFLKLGRTGTEAAAKALGAVAKTYESSDPTTQRQNVEAAARAGAKVVVTVGFEFNDIIPQAAKAHPGVKFLMVDTCTAKPLPNVYCGTFREYEPSFLAGAEAALTSKSGKVGAVGALDIPLLRRFTVGFAEGAKYARPGITVEPTLWVGGSNPFSDPARGEQRGAAMVAEGADRIDAVGAGSNGGIFKAMTGDALAIGVDTNQCPQAPGKVLDNVVKRTDVLIEKSVAGIFAGTEPSMVSFGLKEGGMNLTGLEPDAASSGCMIVKFPDVIPKLAALREKIIDGSIKLKDPMLAP